MGRLYLRPYPERQPSPRRLTEPEMGERNSEALSQVLGVAAVKTNLVPLRTY